MAVAVLLGIRRLIIQWRLGIEAIKNSSVGESERVGE